MTNWQDVGSGVMMWAPATQVAVESEVTTQMEAEAEEVEDKEDAAITTDWQDIGSGVMIWTPSGAPLEKATVDTTAETLSRLSVKPEIAENHEDEDVATDADSILSTVQEENLRAKQAIFQELFGTPRETRSSTVPPENEKVPFLEEHAFNTIKPPSLASSAASQISAKLYTELDSVLPLEEEPAFSSTPQSLLSSTASKIPAGDTSSSNSIPSLEHTNILDQDSDGTDFLSTPYSPCQTRHRKFGHRQTGLTSHYFEEEQSSSVCRKLDFGVQSKAAHSNAMRLPALEYAPRHKWSYAEKEFLCVLFRWYSGRPANLASIFNFAFDLDLTVAKIHTHYTSLQYYGVDTTLVYESVFSVPFNDPRNEYRTTRRMIESIAAERNVELYRLNEEAVSPSARAKTAKSPKIRERYRQRVKTAKIIRIQRETRRQLQQRPTREAVTGGFASRANDFSEAVDLIVDVEEDVQQSHKHAQNNVTTSSPMPSLAFRTWDEGSGTTFSEEDGFRAGAASVWNGHIPPFRLEDPEGKRMVLVTCNSHFGRDKVPSYWISVFTSLLESLVKAASFTRPRFAVINLRHPSMQVPNKMLPAAKVMRELKSSGQTQWARTKHYAEVLVWHSIPKAAIIRSFDLRDLILLSDTHPVVGQMLQLHEFRTGRKTAAVATSVAQRNVTLDPFSAKAMALVCKKFGLIELSHIQHLVARLVDGWTIIDDASGDIQHIGLTFAMTFGSRMYSREDVVHAFVEGCRQGTQVLQYWDAVRSSGSRRTKRR